ncbi:unnamed protein product, partial [Arabidopsis halleri]
MNRVNKSLVCSSLLSSLSLFCFDFFFSMISFALFC